MTSCPACTTPTDRRCGECGWMLCVLAACRAYQRCLCFTAYAKLQPMTGRDEQ